MHLPTIPIPHGCSNCHCRESLSKPGCSRKLIAPVGETKSLDEGVITTRTSAPCLVNKRTSKIALKAAMLPVMPKMIFFPFNIPV
jgi:hypothetical protein